MKFRKKPVIIEAVQIPVRFSNNAEDYPKWFVDAVEKKEIVVTRGMMTQEVKYVEIKTLEGTMVGNVGDYIIKGVNGEFYPCKPDIFEKTYESPDNVDEPEIDNLKAECWDIVKAKNVDLVFFKKCIQINYSRYADALLTYNRYHDKLTKEEFDKLRKGLKD